MYIVIREAVYNRGIFFSCETEIEAVDVCNLLRKKDGDDYHTWSVYLYKPELFKEFFKSQINKGLNYEAPEEIAKFETESIIENFEYCKLIYSANKNEILIDKTGE